MCILNCYRGAVGTIGMFDVLAGIVQREHLFALWKGMTPVSNLLLIRSYDFQSIIDFFD